MAHYMPPGMIHAVVEIWPCWIRPFRYMIEVIISIESSSNHVHTMQSMEYVETDAKAITRIVVKSVRLAERHLRFCFPDILISILD